jgi:hypothetical protein
MRRQSSKPRLRGLWILPLVLLGLGLWALTLGAASALAPRLVDSLMPQLETQLEQVGVGLGDLSFAAIRISPWLTAIRLQDVNARLDLNPGDRIRLRSELAVETVEVRLTDLLALRGSIRATGLQVRLDASDRLAGLPFDRFANAQLAVGDLPLAQPRRTVDAVRGKLKELFFDNKAIGDLDFSGDVTLELAELELVAHLYTEQVGDGFRLRFSEADIREISDRKGMGLVPEQVEIVSLYPLRAPMILLLTDQARNLAKRHEPADAWLQDAHRHVTWSFLLTRAFGPEFASRVTDAQEMRPGNTPDERAMDFHNNAIGRKLFADRIALAALPRLVREDPTIIRHPDEVAGFDEERLLR